MAGRDIVSGYGHALISQPFERGDQYFERRPAGRDSFKMLNRGCCRGTGDELRHDLIVVMPSAFANRVEQLHERRAVLLEPRLIGGVEAGNKPIEPVCQLASRASKYFVSSTTRQ